MRCSSRWPTLERRGFDVTRVPPGRDGAVDPDAILAAVRPDTLLISLMHVNNETGVMQPVAAVADALEGTNAYLHVDAAQSFGRELPALRHPRIDLISVSAHKINGPKGVGALVMRRRNGQRPPLQPLMFGGGQERGLRPGHDAGPARGRIRSGGRARCRARPTTRAARCLAFREVAAAGLGATRARRQRRSRPRRCRTFSTCLSRVSPPRPQSMPGAGWWRFRTARRARRRATPAATS